MHEYTEKQLMLDKEGDKVLSEDFETSVSFVADSVGQSNKEANGSDLQLGLYVSDSGGPSPGVEQEADSAIKSGGSLDCGLAQVNVVGNNNTLAVAEKMDLISGLHNQLEVRSSQIPSINLLIDLNDAECRKRRRRQFSNLFRV